MKIVLAFAFYFLIITIGCTVGLAIFFIKPLRKFLHKYHQLGNNIIILSIKYFAFVIIGLILIQSIYDFIIISRHIDQQHMDFEGFKLQKLNLITAGSHGNTLQGAMETLREYRKYYESERNMMLTSSAFFAYFIFNRVLAAIIKLAGIQNDIENPSQAKPNSQIKKEEAKQNQKGHAKVQ